MKSLFIIKIVYIVSCLPAAPNACPDRLIVDAPSICTVVDSLLACLPAIIPPSDIIHPSLPSVRDQPEDRALSYDVGSSLRLHLNSFLQYGNMA